MTSPGRFGFAGTSVFAAHLLDGLIETGIEIGLVVTQPDRPAGRRRALTPPPVALAARGRGIATVQPELAAEALEPIRLAGLRAMAICGYGNLVPAALLDELPWLNLHPSILPRWRGAAPIERALLAGDAETGVAVLLLVEELDAGPVVEQRRFALGARDDRCTVEERVLRVGVPDLAASLRAVAAGTLRAEPQPRSGISYAHKLSRSDRALDPTETVATTLGRVRAFAGSTLASIDLGGQPVGIARAHAASVPVAPGGVEGRGAAVAIGVADGAIEATELQAPGRRPLDAGSFLRGYRRPLAPARRLPW